MTRAKRATPAASYDASGLVTGGVALENRTARGETTNRGRSAVSSGLTFIGLGLGLPPLLSRTIARVAGPGRGVPPWILALVGFLVALAGLALVVRGVRDLRWEARVRDLRAAYPSEPWRWDHPWDERGAWDDPLALARYYLVGAVFLFAFLTPFHWLGFVAKDRSLPFGIAALVFDAVGVVLLVGAGYFAARRIKYGRGAALFERFPFRRGSTLELFVEAPPTLPQHALATATLRCVQEREVTEGTGRREYTSVECFEVYRDTAPAELMDAGGGRRALKVAFAIPADAPATDLVSRPCRYWEVDIEAATDGVDYAARFLVPVY